MNLRVRLRVAAVAVDAIALVAANVLATSLRGQAHLFMPVRHINVGLDWALAVSAVSVLAGFHLNGLYEREVFVSRPLHVLTLARVSLVAFMLSAVTVYLLRSNQVEQSRFVLLVTFALFLLFTVALRIAVLDPLLVRMSGTWVTMLVGDSREARALTNRLGQLRGFDKLSVFAPADVQSGFLNTIGRLIEERPTRSDFIGAVFIDTLSVKPRDVFDITSACRHGGLDVYVLSGLLGPLEGNRLLSMLYQAPVIRMRRSIDQASPHVLKRAFDIVGSSALLILACPVVAVVAVLVKVTSKGPVFFRQTRVGRHGVPFKFLKFRSMVVNNDYQLHADYVTAFIAGEAETVSAREGDVFKCVDDPRITSVGRFIRRYSLDEIPQFWNVLRGDMSLVGPRPPLAYEVEQYDEWATMRLRVPQGVTGIWQVEGRSRVSFDEMILQDLMYAKNMSLAVDIGLCLRTVPAVVLGRGGG